MNTIRVIGGKIRGKVIPFVNKKFDDADITPQRVKGAIFSMLGEDLAGLSFLDLFGGSGQIGIEAWSRGGAPVFLVEPELKRFKFVKSFIESNQLTGAEVLNYKAEKALNYFQSRHISFDFIFLDPPYFMAMDNASVYDELINKIINLEILSDKGILVVQHASASVLPEKVARLSRDAVKKYGSTSLSVYRCNDND